jgi:hypothetical protein
MRLGPPTKLVRGVGLPLYRNILAVDVEGSARSTNPIKGELRRQLYELVTAALRAEGIDRYCDRFVDRGDGLLVLVQPVDEVPKAHLLNRLMPALASLVFAYNSSISPAEQQRILRLRAVLHAGEVHVDSNGFFGEDLDVAFRLLDAPRFKSYFRSIRQPLALVVSAEIYQSLVRHGYAGIDDREFYPLVTVNVGGQRRKGWVHIPRTAGYSQAHQPRSSQDHGSAALPSASRPNQNIA